MMGIKFPTITFRHNENECIPKILFIVLQSMNTLKVMHSDDDNKIHKKTIRQNQECYQNILQSDGKSMSTLK